ncbi:hypothetical protein [Caballeronia sp. LZ035]|uniref:hypothetical protein n=1 Tax=Caballeronia sp. LZ035 TaxID=3038568 RepID=UPI0028561710|nr:hypothetical protein [Caballeronia sp. LZ035]MDR5762105.1 hypothetical protein [Caballeronia sp. LZ035]
MSCNQPPCNTCLKPDCRRCPWTSPSDGAKRAPERPTATQVFITLTVERRETGRAWSSWLRQCSRRVLALFRR